MYSGIIVVCTVKDLFLYYVFVGRLQNLFSDKPLESEELIESSSLSEQEVSESLNECNNRKQILRDRLKEKSSILKSQLLSDMV